MNKMKSKKKGEAMLVSLLNRAMLEPRKVSNSKKKKPNKNNSSVVALSATPGSSGRGLASTKPIRFMRHECVQTLSVPAQTNTASGNFSLIPANFVFLASLGKCFERIRWNSVSIYYKPAVGTTFGGLVSIGTDWDSKNPAKDRKNISGYTPNASFPAWGDTERQPMRLPAQRIQSVDWYTPASDTLGLSTPCTIVWAADITKQAVDTTLGELWIEYDVSFDGTKS